MIWLIYDWWNDERWCVWLTLRFKYAWNVCCVTKTKLLENKKTSKSAKTKKKQKSWQSKKFFEQRLEEKTRK